MELQEASLLAKIGIPVLTAAFTLAILLYMRAKKRADDERDMLAAEVKRRADEERAKLANDVAARVLQIGLMELQIAELRTQVAPMWAVALKRLTDDLHHPSAKFADGDKLLEEFMSLTLTPERHKRFVEFLENRLATDDPDISVKEKESAGVMLILARRVADEAASRLESD